MDPLDAVPYAPGPTPPEDGNRTQDIVGGAVAFFLPLTAICLLTVTELSKQPSIAMLWMPIAFTALGLVVCVVVRMGPWRTFITSLACLWWCLVAGTTLVVIDILIFPF
jgi:hypothetical protein